MDPRHHKVSIRKVGNNVEINGAEEGATLAGLFIQFPELTTKKHKDTINTLAGNAVATACLKLKNGKRLTLTNVPIDLA